MYIVYGKSDSMRRYMPIGKYDNDITFVDKIVYAYMYDSKEDAEHIKDMLANENPDITFEVRKR